MSQSRAALSGPSAGIWSLFFGLLSVVGLALIGQASFGWIPAFDPAGWLRIVSGWMIPVGMIGAVVFGVRSLRRGSGRGLGITGLALAMLTLGAFVAMLVTADY
jgi:hypothetical protein